MATIKLKFENAQGKSLDDLEVSNDIAVREVLPYLLRHLDLSPQKEWQLVIPDQDRVVDLEQSFAQNGLSNGSLIRVTDMPHCGRYELRHRVEEGGMGILYEGYDPNLRRRVAIKIIKEEFAHDEAMMDRFTREAQSVARLEGHPHVVAIYDFEFKNREDSTPPFLAMEFIDGRSLDDLIEARNGLPLEEMGDVLTGVASALDAAHAQGIIHRDVKPSNILLVADVERPGKWIPKLVDFGLVRISAEPSKHTKAGNVFVGSPHYMSPEQIEAKPLSPQSDIYSLGIVAYEMLTGERPFRGSSQTKIMVDQVSATPPSPRLFRSDISPEVEQVILKALSKDPRERYKSAGEFARVFNRTVNAGVKSEPSRSSSKIRSIHVLGVAALVLLIGVGVWFLLSRLPSVERAEELMQSGSYERAISMCEQLAERNPQDEDARECLVQAQLLYADQLVQNGEIDAAQSVYEGILERDPQSTECLGRLVQLLLQKEEWDDAAILAEQWTQVDDESGKAWESLGQAYYHQERYAQACAVMREAISRGEGDSLAPLLEGIAADGYNDALFVLSELYAAREQRTQLEDTNEQITSMIPNEHVVNLQNEIEFLGYNISELGGNQIQVDVYFKILTELSGDYRLVLRYERPNGEQGQGVHPLEPLSGRWVPGAIYRARVTQPFDSAGTYQIRPLFWDRTAEADLLPVDGQRTTMDLPWQLVNGVNASVEDVAFLGWYHYERGELEEARENFELALSKEGNNLESLLGISRVYAALELEEELREVNSQIQDRIPNQTALTFDGVVRFLGYDVEYDAPSGVTYIGLFFSALEKMQADYRIALRAYPANTNQLPEEAQVDGFLRLRFDNTPSTHDWLPGAIYYRELETEELAIGEWEFSLGLWDAKSEERASLTEVSGHEIWLEQIDLR